MAQLGERCVRNAEVASSNLVISISYFIHSFKNGDIAQLGEHLHHTQVVAGSSPVAPIFLCHFFFSERFLI